MELNGHKTRRVFDRYNIVNGVDRARTSELLKNGLAVRRGARKVTPLQERAVA